MNLAERLGPLQWRQIFSRKSLAGRGHSPRFAGRHRWRTLVTIPDPVGVLEGSLKVDGPGGTIAYDFAQALWASCRWARSCVRPRGRASGPGWRRASPNQRAGKRKSVGSARLMAAVIGAAGLARGLAVGAYGRRRPCDLGRARGRACARAQARPRGRGRALGVGLLAGLAGLRDLASLPSPLVQLAGRRRTPVRLMRFLNDARERGVLRTVGPVYQFRHARLQDRLARTAPALEEAQQLEELLARNLRVQGPDHPDTLATRAKLAHSQGRAGDAAGAAQLFGELLADRLRMQGPDHPDTLITRSYLAYWRWQAGDAAGAAKALEELLADRLRMQGPDHPDTLATRANLASVRGRAQNS